MYWCGCYTGRRVWGGRCTHVCVCVFARRARPAGIRLLCDWQEEMSTSWALGCAMKWNRYDSTVQTFQQVDIAKSLERCYWLYIASLKSCCL